MPLRSRAAAMLIFVCMSPAGADDSLVRELEAYCVSQTGVRTGVAASQDGAALAYVQAADHPPVMVRTVHNRSRVSDWHQALDQAGFDSMASVAASTPYCAIERLNSGGAHSVRWPEGRAPSRLGPVFDAIMHLHEGKRA